MYIDAVISSIHMQGSVLDHDNYNPKMCHAETGNLMSGHYTMYLMQLMQSIHSSQWLWLEITWPQQCNTKLTECTTAHTFLEKQDLFHYLQRICTQVQPILILSVERVSWCLTIIGHEFGVVQPFRTSSNLDFNIFLIPKVLRSFICHSIVLLNAFQYVPWIECLLDCFPKCNNWEAFKWHMHWVRGINWHSTILKFFNYGM